MSENVIIEKLDKESVELNIKYENWNGHGIQTLKCLDAMRKERQLCDIILTVQGLELFLHDEIDISTKKQIYYQIDGLEHPALKLILQFIYQGR
jgi:hypothetical protein